ncbi:MAG: SAM-dependent methyltransferase [Saprospiraceae bacterium]|nr:SAM-dependent methyltransferase [Saprospiraceae bacterium]
MLYLVPTVLAPDTSGHIPPVVKLAISECQHFIVESLKLSRRHIKKLVPAKVIDNCTFMELNEHTDSVDYSDYLEPATNGHNICLLSDAGSPAIADPGAVIVRLAHRQGIRVVPLSGPSSILLALMASGFDGQQFHFHGYLSRDQSKRKNQLRAMEQQANKKGVTQIFMETPYRNRALLEDLLRVLNPHTQVALAVDLTSHRELVKCHSVGHWKKLTDLDLHKKPCIFMIGV